MKMIQEKRVRFAIGIFLFMGCGILLWQDSFAANESDQETGLSAKPPLTEGLFKKGETLYQKQCAVCHGPQGAADGKAAYLLYPKPRDFTRDKFRLVSTMNMDATDEDLFKTISRGMPGSAMPPWEYVSVEGRWALVYYVRFLSEIKNQQKSGELSKNVILSEIPWEQKEKMIQKKIDSLNMIQVSSESPVTPDSLANGRQLFVASCAGCHGQQGKGDGGQEMKDNLGVPLKPRDLTAGIFKGASSSKDLYFRMLGGMPGSPMPSYKGVFTDEQIWDLIHYVQTLPKAGAEERARLHHLRLTAKKIHEDITLNPFAEYWSKEAPVFVSQTPLWWRNDRIEGLDVKAVHNKKEIAFYLKWSDAMRDDNNVAVHTFSDGAALQFSTEKDPPFFGMGEANQPVYIWHWKAAWQNTGKEREDIETQYPAAAVDWYYAQKNYEHGNSFEVGESETRFHDPQYITGWGAGNPLSDPETAKAVEEATSEGQGSYTIQRPKIEPVEARGVWQNGHWHVVFKRPLKNSEKGALRFKAGDTIAIAFAVWDGAQKDRNGQKTVSIWNEILLEK